MNIIFNYCYRDAANYKKWNDIVFSNVGSHDVESLEKKVKKILIDGEFFVARKAKLPEMKFDKHIPEIDHDWHAFHSFSNTENLANDIYGRDVIELIHCLKVASDEANYWLGPIV